MCTVAANTGLTTSQTHTHTRQHAPGGSSNTRQRLAAEERQEYEAGALRGRARRTAERATRPPASTTVRATLPPPPPPPPLPPRQPTQPANTAHHMPPTTAPTHVPLQAWLTGVPAAVGVDWASEPKAVRGGAARECRQPWAWEGCVSACSRGRGEVEEAWMLEVVGVSEVDE